MNPRTWDWWTEQKLDILSDYLQAFTTASRKANKTVYLDLFAGVPQNVSREHGYDISGSAWRALEVQPPFSVLGLFEQSSKAEDLQAALAAQYPQRGIRIYPGDCNEKLDDALTDLRPLNWAPTFAFLDQESAEVRWSSLQRLAQHKRSDKPKVELWLLFATGMIPRGLQPTGGLDGLLNTRFADAVSDMFGTKQWLDVVHGRRKGLLGPAEFRDELRNLMRWQLETHLGYKWTQVFNVVNTGGTEIYDMIFATDHDVGHKIMRDVYDKAARLQPSMRQQAIAFRNQRRDEQRGQVGLFDVADVDVRPTETPGDSLYMHTPPWRPYQLPRD